MAPLGRLGEVEDIAGVVLLLAPIRKGDVDNFDKVIATNLRGSYLVMSKAANHVVDGGRIIVFSSSVLGKSFRFSPVQKAAGSMDKYTPGASLHCRVHFSVFRGQVYRPA